MKKILYNFQKFLLLTIYKPIIISRLYKSSLKKILILKIQKIGKKYFKKIEKIILKIEKKIILKNRKNYFKKIEKNLYINHLSNGKQMTNNL